MKYILTLFLLLSTFFMQTFPALPDDPYKTLENYPTLNYQTSFNQDQIKYKNITPTEIKYNANTTLIGCILSSNWNEQLLHPASTNNQFISSIFDSIQFNNQRISNITSQQTIFYKNKFRSIHFFNSKFHNTQFYKSSFNNVLFSHSTFTGSDFSSNHIDQLLFLNCSIDTQTKETLPTHAIIGFENFEKH